MVAIIDLFPNNSSTAKGFVISLFRPYPNGNWDDFKTWEECEEELEKAIRVQKYDKEWFDKMNMSDFDNVSWYRALEMIYKGQL